MQFDRKADHKRIVNKDSIRMPFEEPGAYWIYPNSVLFCYSSFRCFKTSFPGKDKFAKQAILIPPAEQQMISIFEHSL